MFKFKNNLLKARFFNNGKATHSVSSFQIIQAKQCPKLSYYGTPKSGGYSLLKRGKKLKCSGTNKLNVVDLKCPTE